MDCPDFEILLFRGLDRAIAADDRQGMLAHERSCLRCRRLASLVRGHREPDTTELADTFLAGVMASTAGRPCEQARRLMTSDEGVAPDDTELLALHLETCADCAAVSRVLARVGRDLPALAEGSPGEAFVASVMMATLGAREPVRDNHHGWLRRVASRLIARPRFAAEFAYAVTASALLVFGLPSPSTSWLPARALDGASQIGTAFEGVLAERAGDATRIGQTRWAELTVDARSRLEQSLETGSAETLERMQTWSEAAQRFVRDVQTSVVVPNLEGLRSLWNETESDAVEPNTGESDNI